MNNKQNTIIYEQCLSHSKMKILNLIFIIFLVSVMISPITIFAEPSIILEKNSYITNDIIKVSGKVVFQENTSLVIQIRSLSDIVAIKQLTPSKSGSFSTSFDAVGPKWVESGTYTMIVSYADEKSEKTFEFSTIDTSEKGETAIDKIYKTKTESIQEKIQPSKSNLKISMLGFPDPALSPNYYIDLYNTDSVFKKLFDTSFPGYKIQEMVGYKSTHISGFPDPALSPQYYVDRYSNEPRFKIWFDSQFPDNDIYDIVGISEKTRPSVPSWIKQYAQSWSNDEITDSQFASGITELIQRKILLISDDLVKTKNPNSDIPSWFKNTALWYSNDTITENDFLFGLQYLIEKEIIVIQAS